MFHFIVNPASKSGRGEIIWQHLQIILNDSFTKYHCYKTEYPGHATRIAASLCEQFRDETDVTLVIVGGDGTLNEVLNGIDLDTEIAIAYIPTGSGNDFCRGLSLCPRPEASLESILKRNSLRRIDFGTAKCSGLSHRFAVSAGIGFDANVCRRISVSRLKTFFNRIKIGKFAYLLIGISQIFLEKQTPATIIIDNDRVIHARRLFFLSAQVTKFEGGGFPFAPDARPDDDRLSLCIFYDMSKPGCLLGLLLSLFKKHPSKKGVLTVDCKTVTVKTPVFRNIHTDGEAFGYLNEVTFESGGRQYTLVNS